MRCPFVLAGSSFTKSVSHTHTHTCCEANKANRDEFKKRKAKALAIAKRAASGDSEPADSARTKGAVKKTYKKPYAKASA